MPQGKYRFGPFELNVAERMLQREDSNIPLRGKVFETLCFLVEHAGRLVRKEELLEAIWPDAVVEENNLTQQISVLRKALGEGATGQNYIETIPRIGYRFVAPVTNVVPGEISQAVRRIAMERRARQEIRYTK